MKNEMDLQLSSYDFDLPEALIAQRPVSPRDNSRLFVYDVANDKVTHAKFYQLSEFLPQDSVLVLNKTKVFPCRLFGKKPTGGQAEVFLLNISSDENGFYDVLIKTSGKKKVGDLFYFKNDLILTIERLSEGTFKVSSNQQNLLAVLENCGHIPIPPYIRGGESDQQDRSDYQTTFADKNQVGSVAAPTAGLHFTSGVFESLSAKNIERAEVSLHVGMGTFSPVKSENIRDHKMHSELYQILPEVLEKLNSKRKIFAVGTTSLRSLESSYSDGTFSFNQEQGPASTDIFLYPGKEVNSIDGIITNFHLPKSSLLMLISALIGREKVMELYKEAIKEKYRFFSYGDAMLILR